MSQVTRSIVVLNIVQFSKACTSLHQCTFTYVNILCTTCLFLPQQIHHSGCNWRQLLHTKCHPKLQFQPQHLPSSTASISQIIVSNFFHFLADDFKVCNPQHESSANVRFLKRFTKKQTKHFDSDGGVRKIKTGPCFQYDENCYHPQGTRQDGSHHSTNLVWSPFQYDENHYAITHRGLDKDGSQHGTNLVWSP